MSCTSPLTVASTIVPFCWPSTRSICGSRQPTAAFIVSADCSTKGSCILPAPKSSPTTFMPSSRKMLMMSSGGCLVMASARSSSSPWRSPSTMRCFSRSSTASGRAFFAVFAATRFSKSAMKACSGS